ncbi:MAG TPA: hypothetical protein VEB40_02335, partial [Flavipsychrobacter sp.]|nr:hypothetical protein [Flavipsychrobacter sp.]
LLALVLNTDFSAPISLTFFFPKCFGTKKKVTKKRAPSVHALRGTTGGQRCVRESSMRQFYLAAGEAGPDVAEG